MAGFELTNFLPPSLFELDRVKANHREVSQGADPERIWATAEALEMLQVELHKKNILSTIPPASSAPQQSRPWPLANANTGTALSKATPGAPTPGPIGQSDPESLTPMVPPV